MSSLTDIVDADEAVVLAVHRHWISLVFPLFSAFLVGAVGLLIFYALGRYTTQIQAIGPLSMVALAGAAILGLSVILVIAHFSIYARNGLVLSNKALYIVTQTSLINRKVSQFDLERLEDVSATQRGYLGTLFNYGDIVAKTAGEDNNMVFAWAPDPEVLADRIVDASEGTK